MKKIFIAILLNSWIVYILLGSFVLHNFDSYVDVFSYIEHGMNIKNNFESIISVPFHYWLRIVLPLFFLSEGINDISLILYAISNVLMNYASIYLFIKGFFKYIGVHWPGKKYSCAIFIFLPGVIFTTSTMKPEWPTILILGVVLWLISNKSFLNFALASTICLFARPSVVISCVALWTVKYICRRPSVVGIFFVCFAISLLVEFVYSEVFEINFFESAHYLFTYYEDDLRNWMQVQGFQDVWKMPVKYVYSLFLDSNIFLGFNWFNPENINQINGFFRVIIIATIMLRLLAFNIENAIPLQRALVVYVGITAPSIMLTGFYQTRYLVCGDLVLVACVYLAFKGRAFLDENFSNK